MIESVSVEMCCSLALSPPISDLLVAVQRPAISRFLMNEVRLIRNSRKPVSGAIRSSAERLSIAIRFGWNSSTRLWIVSR